VLRLLHDPLVALGLAEFDEFAVVADAGFEFLDGTDLQVEFVTLAHQRPRLLGVGPELGRFGARVEVV
jgi:hypothetical protein